MAVELTHDYLKSVLIYKPKSGVFHWRHTNEAHRAGEIAGSKNQQGYLQILVGGKIYRAHRLAWLYMTGSWPSRMIDHRDRNKLNNSFENLRDVSNSTNLRNSDRVDNADVERILNIFVERNHLPLTT